MPLTGPNHERAIVTPQYKQIFEGGGSPNGRGTPINPLNILEGYKVTIIDGHKTTTEMLDANGHLIEPGIKENSKINYHA